MQKGRQPMFKLSYIISIFIQLPQHILQLIFSSIMINSKTTTPSKSSVMGLKIEGSQLIPQLISIDQEFEKCPIAHAAGIPLYVKRLMNVKAKKHTRYAIVRMMSQPQDGIAPLNWQYGGLLCPAPPVLVARSDLIQFDISDWKILDDFEMEMLDDGPRKVTRKDFIQFVKANYLKDKSNIVLEVLYPKGQKCKVDGLLESVQLNGKIGFFNGIYCKQRIGVSFDDIKGKFGLKQKNLQYFDKEQTKQQQINPNSRILPQVILIKQQKKTKKLWLQRNLYSNYRVAIYAYDYPQLYDVITYNLPDEDIAYNQVVVPVSDRHEWKKQLLNMVEYFEDTKRRIKTGFIYCQIWRLKNLPKAHRQCMINQKCICWDQKK